MCLSVPGCVVEIDRDRQDAVVAVLDARRDVSVMLVPEVEIGDWVLVHVGFAISRIDEAEAEASLALLGDALEAEEHGFGADP